MDSWADIERCLQDGLALQRPPVAVAFREKPPDGVARFEGIEPSSCSFWRLAAEGQSFYTVSGDHYNCPLGAYTHNIALPRERAGDLQQTLDLMIGVGYLRAEEVPAFPRLQESPAVIVYAPLGRTPVDPDLVLLTGRPGRLMLLQEAAIRAGSASPSPLLGRPTCMALPAALQAGLVLSAGCVGNRVYTEVGEDEAYAAMNGRDIRRIAEALGTITAANSRLGEYHRERRRTLASE
jgi:uncharacterized protein (DUF169 family)